ncbi:LysR family transcriptional regulator [Pendulispora rubella]|uniref:LysR family transcriptional regulator n=1 Tax=Pendulispora rubella TaxID=2741070 RepID=A0ABZ2LDG5_9BACT
MSATIAIRRRALGVSAIDSIIAGKTEVGALMSDISLNWDLHDKPIASNESISYNPFISAIIITMDLRQLTYFIAVAEERSFSRGARREHVVQSAVSAAVSRLEQELEVKLFDRSTRDVALTPAGAALLPEAKATLGAARRARESVATASGELGGSVIVGSLQSSGPLDLPAVLAGVHAAHPKIVICLRQVSTGTEGHLAAVASGDIDLALVSTSPQANGSTAAITLHALTTEPLLFVCHRNHALASRKRVELRELAEQIFVNFAPGWGYEHRRIAPLRWPGSIDVCRSKFPITRPPSDS